MVSEAPGAINIRWRGVCVRTLKRGKRLTISIRSFPSVPRNARTSTAGICGGRKGPVAAVPSNVEPTNNVTSFLYKTPTPFCIILIKV